MAAFVRNQGCFSNGGNPMRTFRTLMAVAAALCLLPIVSVFLAMGLASYGGCQLDEGSVHPCVIAGVDLGETLYGMAVAGWFAIGTLPILAALALVWAAIEAWRFARRAS
jgi:hypothetical protein